MKSLGVDYGEIMQGNFFAIEPRPTFDIVVSFGFIEHFDSPLDAMKRQIAWLAPGGIAVFGVPNFRGVYRSLQRILDPGILDRHNLRTMSAGFFERAQRSLEMELTEVHCIGSIEPSLLLSSRRGSAFLTAFRATLSVLSRLRNRLSLLDDVNTPVISSYFLATYRMGATFTSGLKQ